MKNDYFFMLRRYYTLSPFSPTAPGVPGGPLRPSAP